MKKSTITTILLTLIILSVFTIPAFAGVADIWAKTKGLITTTDIAWGLSILLGIGIIAKYTSWISSLMVSLGGLLIVVGLAIGDSKITKEELQAVKDKWTEFIISFKNRGSAK